MAERLRVGIVGAGGAGRAHAAAFARLPGVAVTAVWGRTRARAEALASETAAAAPPARVYDAWEALVDGAEVDVVSVATPPLLQRPVAAAALARGRHVLVEKECGRDLADAQALVAAAARAGTVTAVSLNWRYAPSTLTARRAVERGAIGDLLELRMEWRYRLTDAQAAALTATKPWVLQPAQGGGGLRGGGSHEFDRARFLTGWDFARVAARIDRAPVPEHPGLEMDRRVALLADMDSPAAAGRVAVFFAAFTPGEPERRAVLCGRDGTLVCTTSTPTETVTLQRADDDAAAVVPVAAEDAPEPGGRLLQHTWNRLIADLVGAIRAGDVAHATVSRLPRFVDGVRLHEVFAAAERADAESRWVDLAEVRSDGA
jgi:predicted dehydrogenase